MDAKSSKSSSSQSGESEKESKSALSSYGMYTNMLNLNNLGGDDFEVRNNTDIDPAEFFTSQKMEQYQKPQSDVEEEAILTTA